MDDYLSEETKLLFGEIHARIPLSVTPSALVLHFAVCAADAEADDIIASPAPFGIVPGAATAARAPVAPLPGRLRRLRRRRLNQVSNFPIPCVQLNPSGG